MSGYMADLGGVLGTRQVGNTTINITRKGSNLDLDMTDFITLMITQMTNQGIDETMDTSEMLNQMVQMQMIQSMVNMTDATLMNYSASLVGKEVTVGKWVDGKLQEIVGTVTGTGTKDGQPVIFLDNDEYYYLSEIMAVGRLPQTTESEGGGNAGNSGSGDDNITGVEPAPDLDPDFGVDHDVDVNVDPDLIPEFGIDQNSDLDGTEGAEGSDQTDGSGSVEGTDQTETPEYDGSNGAETDSEE